LSSHAQIFLFFVRKIQSQIIKNHSKDLPFGIKFIRFYDIIGKERLGNGMQRAQLESILKGDTVLAKRAGKGSDAETVTKDGKRTVYLDNYKETMSREEKLAMGITLGHEAYRDGLVGTEQQQFMETTRAVIGHTEMALRMQADKRHSESMDSIIGGSDILQKDIAAYKSGDLMTMLGHAAGNYDWSKDYWRVTKDKKGNILKIENDNSNDITYVDEYGNVTGKDEYRGGSRSEFLADKLGMSSKEQVREMLSNAGYTYNPNTGFFEGKNAKQAFDITGLTEMQAGAEKQGNWIIHATGEAKQFFEAGGKKVSSGLTRFGNKMGDNFDRIFKRGIYSKEYETLKSKYDSVAGLPYSANKSDWIMDKESILTADSKGFNCIGFVTYMYGIEAKYSVANFEAYSHFKKLSGITSFDKLQIGDVIRWRGVMSDGRINNHVQIYAGNGYVWESADSPTKNGVRYWDVDLIKNWYEKETMYEVDYFRPKKEEWKK